MMPHWLKGERMADKTIEQVLAAHTSGWMSITGVVGTAIGERSGEPCLRIMVVKKTPKILEAIPDHIEGFPVDVVEVGTFRARHADG
jgi:hypothetical protein